MNSNIGISLGCSIVIACIFQYMPMSQSLIGLKPNFLLLNTLGWIIFVPKRFGTDHHPNLQTGSSHGRRQRPRARPPRARAAARRARGSGPASSRSALAVPL